MIKGIKEIRGNKGEWSEIYALFKLLGDKQLFEGDAALNKTEGLFYPIIKIIRNESGGNFAYELKDDLVIISGDKEELIKISAQDFVHQASKLLAKIQGSKGAFSIPDVEDFMREAHCQTLRAKSTSKTDIRIVIHDPKINRDAELGFSIKSQLGAKATLLNAGRTTNFIYQVCDLRGDQEAMEEINKIDTRSKIKDRLGEIEKRGGKLKFTTLEHGIFKNNLILIDSFLPDILAEALKTFFTTDLTSMKELTENINENNPLGYDKQSAHAFYEYKIKRFLIDIALGMTPSKVWTGVYDATGGYLVVKSNGDVLCYHVYNRNQLEDYLFNNTKLETAASGKHEFGKIYQEDGLFYFKLNLQIRFL